MVINVLLLKGTGSGKSLYDVIVFFTDIHKAYFASNSCNVIQIAINMLMCKVLFLHWHFYM